MFSDDKSLFWLETDKNLKIVAGWHLLPVLQGILYL